MTANPPDPFAPGATVDAEGEPGARKPARWLALVGTLMCGLPLMGVGHFVLGRPRRWLGWVAVGIITMALMPIAVRTSNGKLFLVAVAAMVLAFLGSVVDVARARPGAIVPTFGRALAIVILVFVAGRGSAAATKRWLVEAFNIPSGAMLPNLLIGDHVMVKKGHDAERGAAIVFGYPPDPAVDYVKRVVAVGGDVVEMRGGVVIINGSPLPQTAIAGEVPCGEEGARCAAAREDNGAHSYAILTDPARPPQSFGPVTVPAGHLFVLGDNRDNSSDSRVWGTVPAANVRGTVSLVYWSQDNTGVRWSRIGTAPP